MSFMVGRYDFSFGWIATSPSVIPTVFSHWMPLPDAPSAGFTFEPPEGLEKQ
jgi:hypothetical protein